MLEDIISKGVLEMAGSPFEVAVEAASWESCLSIKILVVISVVVVMVFAVDIVSVFPLVFDCVIRSRANHSLEHSISTARIRNEVAFIMILPFCLMVDRYRLYSPSFLDAVRPDFTIWCTIGMLLVYLLLRLLSFSIFKPLRLNSEDLSTVKHIPYNMFIVLVPLMLVTSGIFNVIHVPGVITRTVLLCETTFFYFINVIRVFQFLSHKCYILATFLYLCALEFLPTGLLIASEFLL